MRGSRKTKRYGFVTICSDCGMPIRKEDIAINDTCFTHDYEEHCDIELGIVLCKECLAGWKAKCKGGMPMAIKRFEELQEIGES